MEVTGCSARSVRGSPELPGELYMELLQIFRFVSGFKGRSPLKKPPAGVSSERETPVSQQVKYIFYSITFITGGKYGYEHQ
jgi:hypothetical protein